MIGFPKNSTDLFNFIKKRQRKGYLSSKKGFDSFLKEQTKNYLSKGGLPLKKQEGWKYFPTQKIIQANYLFPEEPLESGEFKENQSLLPQSFKIFVKNGNPHFSKTPKGVRVFLWKDFLEDSLSIDKEIKNKIYESLKKERNSFCSLNNILSLNGLILLIDKTLKETIEIQYLQNLNEKNKGIHLRTFVFIKANCSAQILETFYGNENEDSSAFFFNLQTDCFLGKKARLNCIRLDQGQSATTQINQLFGSLEREAKACFLTLNLNSGLSRYLTYLSQKEKSFSEVKGLSLLGEDKHSDHKVVVQHQEESDSNQFYQSLLFDSAKHIFNGVVVIDQKAQKTSAHQLNKNLLFSKRAFSVSCPELDIKADDVKATHGATVSSIEDKKEMLFYLQSRGFSLKQSIQLLLSGLIREVLSFMDKKIISHFEPLLWKHLKSLQKSKDKEL